MADTTNTPAPTLGRIVHYRGRHGLHAKRAAIVTCTVAEWVPSDEPDALPPPSTPEHVHLHVFSAGGPGFDELDVPRSADPADPTPGTWQWPTRTV